jgi:hypothetical protein
MANPAPGFEPTARSHDVTSSRLFRAASVTGALACGILAVLTTSASAAGEEPGLPGLAGLCEPGVTADVELASQQYARLPDGGVTGRISVTFSCPSAELPRTGSPG